MSIQYVASNGKLRQTEKVKSWNEIAEMLSELTLNGAVQIKIID